MGDRSRGPFCGGRLCNDVCALCCGMNPTSLVSHESIAHRAHRLWEEAGRPDGDGLADWLQAERELHAQQPKGDEGDPVRVKSAEPPGAAKHAPEKTPHSTDYVHPGVTTDSLHHRRNRGGS